MQNDSLKKILHLGPAKLEQLLDGNGILDSTTINTQ